MIRVQYRREHVPPPIHPAFVLYEGICLNTGRSDIVVMIVMNHFVIVELEPCINKCRLPLVHFVPCVIEVEERA